MTDHMYFHFQDPTADDSHPEKLDVSSKTRFVVSYQVEEDMSQSNLNLKVFDRTQNIWYTASEEVHIQDKKRITELFNQLLIQIEEKIENG
ncbi:MAG: hypothetical protein HRT90_08095 [Candidatus Margulisbacteria bacterium]|nr:hypothetical protein [Candidatus Margulisiibacteriota bacterium]